MKSGKFILVNFFIVSVFIIAGCGSGFKNFVKVEKDKLKDGDKEFRFVSFNIPNLHYLEDYLAFEQPNPWRLPDEFEITDALTSIKQMGGKVVRIYVISVRKDGESKDIIRHVEGPGQFNEQAFQSLDKVLEVANKVGVRVIIPLVDNWHWWGGPREYAAFRGKERDEFWTSPLLISDFKKTINYVLNRKNTFTGVQYKDDKAVLAWETGNELQCPYSWTTDIAAYIKSVDKNHLVIDGATYNRLPEEALNDPNTDILTTHHYVPGKQIVEGITANAPLAKGKKPYFVGEFGKVPAEDVKMIIDTVVNSSVSGVLVWSLRFRNREGGYYNHYESGIYSAYHWPGYESGDPYQEKEVMNILRNSAYKISGEEVPPIPVPKEPVLLEVRNEHEISWQGSAGAASYTIERKESDGGGTWQVIAENISDAATPYRAQFVDTTSVIGKAYFYRVTAKNESGISDASNAVGPVNVSFKVLVDEMENDAKIFQKEGDIAFFKMEDLSKAKEDRSRLSGKTGSSIIYQVPGNLQSIKIDNFLTKDQGELEVYVSENPTDFIRLNAVKDTYPPLKNEYGMFTPVRYSMPQVPEGKKFVKIILNENIQISRIEFKYGETKQALTLSK